MYKSKNLNNSFYCAFAFASVFVFLSFASFMRNIWGKTFNVIPAHSKSWYSNTVSYTHLTLPTNREV